MREGCPNSPLRDFMLEALWGVAQHVCLMRGHERSCMCRPGCVCGVQGISLPFAQLHQIMHRSSLVLRPSAAASILGRH